MKWIIKGESVFMYIALILMSIFAFAQVITRYVFELPNVWIEETTRYLMVWMIFIGMAVAVRKKAHLDVDVVSIFFPSIGGKVRLFYEIVLLVFGTIFSGLTWKMVAFQWEMGQKSPAMQVPMAFIYLGMFVGGILMVIHLVVQLYNRFKAVASETAG